MEGYGGRVYGERGGGREEGEEEGRKMRGRNPSWWGVVWTSAETPKVTLESADSGVRMDSRATELHVGTQTGLVRLRAQLLGAKAKPEAGPGNKVPEGGQSLVSFG